MNDTFTFEEASHTYRLNGEVLPSITQILKETGFVNEEFFTEEGRLRGTRVHRACWYLTESDLDWKSLEKWPEIIPYVRAYDRFLNDTDFKATFCEKPLYHAILRFAGTPDLYGILNGKPAVIDIKTGEVGIHARLQTAAQTLLIGEGAGHQPPKDRYALKLTAEEKYSLRPFEDHIGDRNVFLSALTVANFRRNHNGKR